MQSYSIHSLLCEKGHDSQSLTLTQCDWKNIVVGASSGLNYIIHSTSCQTIIHNDIKEDNVVTETVFGVVKSVPIDFGKACLEKDGKKYFLSAADKNVYRLRHPQAAPDLRDGLCSQPKASDVYSFGRIINSISKKKLTLPALSAISEQCLQYSGQDNPTTNDLHTYLTNLLAN